MRKTAGLRSCLAHSNAHMPGRIRRTRKANVDDPVCDEWEIDFVHGRASGRMGKKYLVRWKGFTEKEDTWEPSENLEGAQDLVKKFNDEQDVLEAQDRKDAVERHQQAVTEKRKREEVSTADANARTRLTSACRNALASYKMPSTITTNPPRSHPNAVEMSLHGGSTFAARAKTRSLRVPPHLASFLQLQS